MPDSLLLCALFNFNVRNGVCCTQCGRFQFLIAMSKPNVIASMAGRPVPLALTKYVFQMNKFLNKNRKLLVKRESLIYLITPLEHIYFNIIGYGTSSIWSLWHISLEETCCHYIVLFPISSKGSFKDLMHFSTVMTAHTRII